MLNEIPFRKIEQHICVVFRERSFGPAFTPFDSPTAQGWVWITH